ncbi:MAG: AraC family transcriptional regulator [Chloroflexaceae bacterium]|nr:AraC family transcriptional regulator [Chloroflexaceae bacterium]
MKPTMLQEKTHYWRDPDVSQLELLRARYITHAFVPHTHEGYAIGVIERGVEQFWYRGAVRVAWAGHVLVINPGEVHTGEAGCDQGWVYSMFYPSLDLLQRAAAELAQRPRDMPFFSQPVISDDELAAFFLRMHQAFERVDSVLERESRLLWGLAHLIARYADDRPLVAQAGTEPARVRLVRDYLEQHYASNVVLDDLAQLAGLSSFHLLRVFRREVGLTPHAYLNQVRIRQACRLLARGLPVATVAAETGFVDQSHLARHFKRIVGVPPGHYRQNSIH